jgi:RHS repeat-associated protein
MTRAFCAAVALLVTSYAVPPTQASVFEPPEFTRFEEPLVPSAPTSFAENAALLAAVQKFQQGAVDDFSAIGRFLDEYPHSPWRVALLTNLGLSYYRGGYFSKAIASWEQAWLEGRGLTEIRTRALADRAVGELARMHARLGHAERLALLFAEIGDRPVSGPATESIQGAREGLWQMQNNPGVAYLCGPMALKNLLAALGVARDRLSFLDHVRSGVHGMSLADLADLATKAGLPHRLVYRAPGQPLPVPSVVHWKVTHFAALLEEDNGRFHIQDPTFGHDLWVTRAALDSESSGYFLAPESATRDRWRKVRTAEATAVRGMGYTGNNQPGACYEQLLVNCYLTGMCQYQIHEMLVSLHLSDTPTGYAPPRGPAVWVRLNYNQREADQPANFSWFNVGPKWTLNWLSYIQDDPPNPRSDVLRYVAGGGSVTYTGFNVLNGVSSWIREPQDAALLVRTSTSPIVYERRLADGGREIYSQSNGATTSPRRVFLTQIIDAQGNTVTLKYDNQLRLTSVVDAMGRATTFTYGNSSKPLLVTLITDPFHRTATIDYDANGRLVRITDAIGMVSQFTYNASGLITAMTTPYGTSKFVSGESGTTRFLEATDALGYTERVEFRQEAPGIPTADPLPTVPRGISLQDSNLHYRNSFYWDKHVFPMAAGDYTKARIMHWNHLLTDSNITGHTLESIKNPLENRTWFTYPGQSYNLYSGTLDKRNNIGRVLDDGTTQITHFEYNPLGHMTRSVDPVGRETQFEYDANQIDLLRVKQKTSATGVATIAEFTYNSQHLPLTVKDAAGKTTTYVYNSFGQPVQITDPLGQTTKFEYDSLGYLLRVVNPNNQTAAAMTYDLAGRVASRTDSEGLAVNYTYDGLDRLTRESYPDGSTREYTWDKLDVAAIKDRQGRITRFTYDAVRNLTEITDAMGRTTQFGYYENGLLKSLTDPNGKTTSWDIDLQGGVTAKHFPDGSTVTYTYERTTGRLQAITDAAGQKKQIAYTSDNQIAAIAYQNAVNPTASVRFTYDSYFRRLTTMVDSAGTTQYRYQPQGAPGALQLAEEDGPYQNDTISYQYDALGRPVSRTIDTAVENFAYDNLSRTVSHRSPLGVFDRSYIGQTGQLTSAQVRDAALGTGWTYDTNTNDRRLKAIAHSSGRGYQLSVTPERAIAQVAETASPDGTGFTPQTWDYTYDDTDRLLASVSSGGLQYAYTYDAAGNIVTQNWPDGQKTVSVGDGNQLTSLNGQAVAYDANGNVTDDGERIYEWDAANRLIAVAPRSQPDRATTFHYDGLGRRTTIVSPDGVETRYLWCGGAICQARDAQDNVLKHYYPEGEASVGGGRLYYARDHLGSVRDILSLDDGSRLASIDYDPYGNPIQSDSSVTSDFRYAGMFYQPDSGLYLTQLRAYDPRSGRWLSRDPAGEKAGVNLYSYVEGSPISRRDVRGDESLWANALQFVNGAVNSIKQTNPLTLMFPMLEPLADLHYARNGYQAGAENLPRSVIDYTWRELTSEDEKAYHIRDGATGNRKFISPNGRCELVFKSDGTLEMNPVNIGTYNFYDPQNDKAGHIVFDVVPYLLFGNTPDDTWDFADRWGATATVVGRKVMRVFE